MTKQASGLGSKTSNSQTKTPSDVELGVHWEYVYNFVNKIIGHRELAEDITQDAFLKAWQHREKYDPSISKLGTWVCAIARNEAINRLRRAQSVSLEECPERGAEFEIPDGETTTRVSKILKYLDKQVNQYGDNPKYGTLLLQRFLGVESPELSKKFGVNRCTIRWRIHFARELFAREWIKRRFTLKKAKDRARRKTRKRVR